MSRWLSSGVWSSRSFNHLGFSCYQTFHYRNPFLRNIFLIFPYPNSLYYFQKLNFYLLSLHVTEHSIKSDMIAFKQQKSSIYHLKGNRKYKSMVVDMPRFYSIVCKSTVLSGLLKEWNFYKSLLSRHIN